MLEYGGVFSSPDREERTDDAIVPSQSGVKASEWWFVDIPSTYPFEVSGIILRKKQNTSEPISEIQIKFLEGDAWVSDNVWH